MSEEINMQDWIEAYFELSVKIKNDVKSVKWIDLWYQQINFIEDEYPFPSPAVFMAFRTDNIESLGLGVQDINCLIDFYVFYETIGDSHKGSTTQKAALGFAEIMRDLHKSLHGKSGKSYSSLNRIGFQPVVSGGSGILYLTTYSCVIRDYSAMAEGEEIDMDEVGFETGKGDIPTEEEDEPLFDLS